MRPVLAGVFERGTLSTAGANPAVDGQRPLCLLEGSIFNLGEIAAALDLAPASEPMTVILAAHRRWGEAVLARLRGNFALLVHDPERRTALLACDQLGARSLFFHRSGPRLAFATEARDLLSLLPVRPPPDEASVVGWLAGTPPADGRTLYGGVHRLGAAGLLRVTERGAQTGRFWAPTHRPTEKLSLAEAGEAAREMLTAAVGRHLPDANCAVLLSGGLDSSTVAALAAKRADHGPPLPSYSVTFPERPALDESASIDDAARGLALAPTELAFHDGSMLGGSLRYLREWALPAPSPNHFLWEPLLRRAARDGVEAMLDGEGGDELWDFSPYLLADRLRSGRLPSALRLAHSLAGPQYRGPRSLGPYLRQLGIKGAVPPSLHDGLRRLHPADRYAPGWLTARSAEIAFAEDDPWTWKRLDGPRWWAYMADRLTSARERLGVGEYLRHRAAMSGLEARHPLIDLDLVEFALRLPPTLALETDLDRPVLREAIVPLVPDSIRLRPGKAHFNELFRDCLAGRDRSTIQELLSEPCEVAAYVDLGTVRRELLERQSGPGDTDLAGPQAIWRLVTAECWLRAQGDDGIGDRLLAQCEPA
jgi:asparagine synthase (glutamine-hydrolysing)